MKEVGGKKEPLITLPDTADLTRAIEVFGSGVHRVLVAAEGTTNVVGVLTQLRLVQFFWENRQSFPGVDQLYSQLIKDLGIGSKNVLAIKYVDTVSWNGTSLTESPAATSLSPQLLS